jgi:hypothetical protein
MAICSDRAWNNFVMRSDHTSYARGSSERAAAIASVFMGGANNGGLNSFLTASYDVDPDEVLDALRALGASKAAHQLEAVINGLGTSLGTSSQDERWRRLESHWRQDLERYDVLPNEAG